MERLALAAAVVLLGCLGACGRDPVATWTLADPPRPEDTSLSLLVHERACSSGRSAAGRVREPEVEYGPDAVTVTVEVETLDGDAGCPGPPPTPYTLRLSEPLGARALVDGGREPAATVAPPP